ncbi:CG18067 [Drosophila busckii]|uniref:CG18067 n=1 Tax=Drosophila busckii TaxID=30019 RepID=A0A0M3QVD9_DROBS|nr:uncharacterized protein LOC108595117 [Drosophila busckii]ALC42249.1 CG18067 [Drosophila busckii]
MHAVRLGLLFATVGVALCSAQTVTDKPSVPGSTLPEAGIPTPTTSTTSAQPVSSFLYNQGGSTVLQNGAGSIYKRPDGRTVLTGADGQTLVTSAEDSDESNESDDQQPGNNNIIINGRSYAAGSSFISTTGNGHGTVLVNQGGEGSYMNYNNHQVRIVNGGLELTTGGKVFNFAAKQGSSQEQVDINGQQATVTYENGNISVELPDGTVLAKTEQGLFGGNRESYANRKQIQENAAREAAQATEQARQLQERLQQQLGEQMRKLQEELQRTLGNLHF